MFWLYNQAPLTYDQIGLKYNGLGPIVENLSDTFSLSENIPIRVQFLNDDAFSFFDNVSSPFGPIPTEDATLDDTTNESTQITRVDDVSFIENVICSVITSCLVQDTFFGVDDVRIAVSIRCGEELAYTDRFHPQRNNNDHKRTASEFLDKNDMPFLQSGKL